MRGARRLILKDTYGIYRDSNFYIIAACRRQFDQQDTSWDTGWDTICIWIHSSSTYIWILNSNSYDTNSVAVIKVQQQQQSGLNKIEVYLYGKIFIIGSPEMLLSRLYYTTGKGSLHIIAFFMALIPLDKIDIMSLAISLF